MSETRFEIKIAATGEVRDKDGNLLNTIPIEATRPATDDEVAAYLKAKETP